VRVTDFWERMRDVFGPHAESLAEMHVLSELDGRTPLQAMAAGVPTRAVWRAVCEALDRLLAGQPRRADIESTLRHGGHAVMCRDAEQAIAISNLIAPEHLELLVADPEALLPMVRHAGAVFTGMYGAASLGDYVAGPSHVLPTYGSARFSSALRVDDFVKTIHVVSADGQAFERLAPHVAALADAEGLSAHAQSVRLRGPR